MKKVLGIKGAEPFRFKIVSYNVLAQAMMTEQSYNFQQHKPDHLAWEHRSKCIQEEIDYIGDPEIICLQVRNSDFNGNGCWFCFLSCNRKSASISLSFLTSLIRKWRVTCTVPFSCLCWRCAVIWACSGRVSRELPKDAPSLSDSINSVSSTPNRFPSKETFPSWIEKTSV